MIELRRLQQEEEEEIGTETERKQAITNIRFGEPYETIRKHSKFDVLGKDLVVVQLKLK
jgi:hypothetical protein